MKYSVRFTDSFEHDLEALHTYLAEHRSLVEADNLLENILAKVDALETFPARGAIPKELDVLDTGDIRQTLLGPYRILYEILDETVLVVMIADGRRDIPKLLEQRLLGR